MVVENKNMMIQKFVQNLEIWSLLFKTFYSRNLFRTVD